jgi:DNA damage-inducible protein 1
MRLIDTRFAGIARGVGTAKILGRVHSAQLKVADVFLPCSFTIMEGRDVDLLFGLDMLKAHQACIDLEKNCLRIQGREIPFLSEHELPAKAREMEGEGEGEASSSSGPSASASQPQQQSFPGGGRTLGSTPAASAPSAARQSAPARPAASRYPEADIQKIMEFGATREVAISTLEAAGGNLDVAVSLLF